MHWKTIYKRRKTRDTDYDWLFPKSFSHKKRKVMFNCAGGHVYAAEVLDQSRILNIFKAEDIIRKKMGGINNEQQMD